jgi:hypothetical protein
MSETERVKPALSAEEWAERRVSAGDEAVEAYCTLHVGKDGRLYAAAGDGRDYYGQGDGLVARPHALAALCLHGQPFGFTREDVDLLHRTINGYVRRIEEAQERVNEGPWVRNGIVMNEASVAALRDLADRIEALLPPEREEP